MVMEDTKKPEQTLNQFFVETDGFCAHESIMNTPATNVS